MGKNLVELNVNPCKMCMPMGAVSAFYGIKNCMSILHGSQGCATYIRRHMATHYNEPVDIASSSLTEQGTVFGGEENLIKGFENLIKLYHPEVIGVATTCLAETIGEDVPAMIKKFHATHPDTGVKIISVSSAGYGGTQYEGYFRALRSVVAQIEMELEKNDSINIITPLLSPADCRDLKQLLDNMGLSYTLLPDLSENLDGVHQEVYERLKGGGTSLEQIAKMAGARCTLELSLFVGQEDSPAAYLYETYGVPYKTMALPIGIRATDALIEELERLGGVKSKELAAERGRFVDAMIDSHKYCADGKAAVFGEPDFVYSVTRLCCENGVVPLLAATGSVCPSLKEMLGEEMSRAAEEMFLEDTAVLDDCDFDTIETYAGEHGINLMFGSSDGRRVAQKLGIPLVRCAFPIHDRVGGQRVRTLLYAGSLNLLDQAANYLLAHKEDTFREQIYNQFFPKKPPLAVVGTSENAKEKTAMVKSIEEKTASHPCFNGSCGQNARIHLPVAPKCNIQCNYCLRKYDCPNESRPGVTTQVLSPEAALQRFIEGKKMVENLTVVGIAGPGDALANFEQTKETLRLIREYDPEITFCLSTNGLTLPLYAQELIDLGVSHVTVTVNAVDPEIGAQIYSHVEYMGTRFTGKAGASLLLANQLAGLRYLTEKGVVCKVNTVVLKGINDFHIKQVAKTMADLGIYMTNIMQMIPVKGSAFEHLRLTSMKDINVIRKECEPFVRQMYHCRQCRADAIGTLDHDLSIEFSGCGAGQKPENKDSVRRYAVASKNGILVDQHFGHAEEFYIYESDGKKVRFVEKRPIDKYCTGIRDCDEKTDKIGAVLAAINDCSGVLALRIGDSPTQRMQERGIQVISTYDRIENAIQKAESGMENQYRIMG